LEAKQLEQQNNVMKKKEAAALEALEAKRAAEAEKAEDEQARAEIVTLTLPHHLSVAMLALQ
jgi:3-hydroxyisobutyrate dehydrogenase-like beta-hydroxyacid dehydrogenase